VATVMDKGRRPGGRLATRILNGGAPAGHDAQFFTVRGELFNARVGGWVADGMILESCRGFTCADGHPRYTVDGVMARLAARMAGVWTSDSPFAWRPCGR
jgi:predicted NAD/FAD-dependent oxidoreductase